MIKKDKLDFWLKNNLNVLFEGHAGVGKTSIVIDTFNRNGLKWKYFSAATMDPWVDLIGIPREVKDSTGQSSYLDLIRPKDFQEDTIEAIFLDEFNRSPKKVRNAVMELLQFKSINGKKFNNLRVVWAAVNPKSSDETDANYDVEPIDPAQLDRFQVFVKIPYACDSAYFESKYGEAHARSAITWWNELDAKTKKLVSPRRLDYALTMYAKEGDVRDVLPKESNISEFVQSLLSGHIVETIKAIIKKNDAEEIKQWVSDPNNVNRLWKFAVKNDEVGHAFYPHIPDEIMVNQLNKSSFLFKQIMTKPEKYKHLLADIYAGNNVKLKKKIAANKTVLPIVLSVTKGKNSKLSSSIGDYMTTIETAPQTYHRKKAMKQFFHEFVTKVESDTADAVYLKDSYDLIGKFVNRTYFSQGPEHQEITSIIEICVKRYHSLTGLVLNSHDFMFLKRLKQSFSSIASVPTISDKINFTKE